VPSSVAHQTGELFAKRARSERNISSAGEVNQACNSVTTLVDLLSKNPSKWKRNSQGNVLFTTKALYEQFNAATQDLNSAIKELNGG
jgi:CHASE3 domain sensor protein